MRICNKTIRFFIFSVTICCAMHTQFVIFYTVCACSLRTQHIIIILMTMFQNNLTELKSFGSPPAAVVNVTGAVLVLQCKKGKVPKDRSWKACKVYGF